MVENNGALVALLSCTSADNMSAAHFICQKNYNEGFILYSHRKSENIQCKSFHKVKGADLLAAERLLE